MYCTGARTGIWTHTKVTTRRNSLMVEKFVHTNERHGKINTANQIKREFKSISFNGVPVNL